MPQPIYRYVCIYMYVYIWEFSPKEKQPGARVYIESTPRNSRTVSTPKRALPVCSNCPIYSCCSLKGLHQYTNLICMTLDWQMPLFLLGFPPGRIQKADPPFGSRIYAVGVLEARVWVFWDPSRGLGLGAQQSWASTDSQGKIMQARLVNPVSGQSLSSERAARRIPGLWFAVH